MSRVGLVGNTSTFDPKFVDSNPDLALMDSSIRKKNCLHLHLLKNGKGKRREKTL